MRVTYLFIFESLLQWKFAHLYILTCYMLINHNAFSSLAIWPAHWFLCLVFGGGIKRVETSKIWFNNAISTYLHSVLFNYNAVSTSISGILLSVLMCSLIPLFYALIILVWVWRFNSNNILFGLCLCGCRSILLLIYLNWSIWISACNYAQ